MESQIRRGNNNIIINNREKKLYASMLGLYFNISLRLTALTTSHTTKNSIRGMIDRHDWLISIKKKFDPKNLVVKS